MNAKKSIRKKDESRYDYLDKIQKTDYKKDYIYGFVLETDDGTFFSAENSYVEEDDEYVFILSGIMSGIGKKEQITRFLRTIVLSHSVLQSFDFTPFILYSNLREAVVRRHYSSEEVEEKFVTAKLEFRNDIDLIGKFSGLKVVNWIHALRGNSLLTGCFIYSFVDYITNGRSQDFPRFLIDNEAIIIKKEVLTYYYHIFPQSEAYRIYTLEGIDPENVIRS